MSYICRPKPLIVDEDNQNVGEYHRASICKMGSGAAAHVIAVDHRRTNTRYALKSVPLDRTEDVDQLFNEAMILQHLHHPNIVKLFQFMQTNRGFYLVLEHLKCNMNQYINECNANKDLSLTSVAAANGSSSSSMSGGLPESVARRLFQQIVAAVHCVHSHHIAHNDIRCENIVIDHQGNSRLIDFGRAVMFDPETNDIMHFAGAVGDESPFSAVHSVSATLKEHPLWSHQHQQHHSSSSNLASAAHSVRAGGNAFNPGTSYNSNASKNYNNNNTTTKTLPRERLPVTASNLQQHQKGLSRHQNMNQSKLGSMEHIDQAAAIFQSHSSGNPIPPSSSNVLNQYPHLNNTNHNNQNHINNLASSQNHRDPFSGTLNPSELVSVTKASDGTATAPPSVNGQTPVNFPVSNGETIPNTPAVNVSTNNNNTNTNTTANNAATTSFTFANRKLNRKGSTIVSTSGSAKPTDFSGGNNNDDSVASPSQGSASTPVTFAPNPTSTNIFTNNINQSNSNSSLNNNNNNIINNNGATTSYQHSTHGGGHPESNTSIANTAQVSRSPDHIEDIDLFSDAAQRDVFDLGIVLFVILTGDNPFSEYDDAEEATNRANFGSQIQSHAARQLVKGMINFDPTKQYTLGDVCHHPWFAVDLDFEKERLLFADHGVPRTSGLVDYHYEMDQVSLTSFHNHSGIANGNDRTSPTMMRASNSVTALDGLDGHHHHHPNHQSSNNNNFLIITQGHNIPQSSTLNNQPSGMTSQYASSYQHTHSLTARTWNEQGVFAPTSSNSYQHQPQNSTASFLPRSSSTLQMDHHHNYHSQHQIGIHNNNNGEPSHHSTPRERGLSIIGQQNSASGVRAFLDFSHNKQKDQFNNNNNINLGEMNPVVGGGLQHTQSFSNGNQSTTLATSAGVKAPNFMSQEVASLASSAATVQPHHNHHYSNDSDPPTSTTTTTTANGIASNSLTPNLAIPTSVTQRNSSATNIVSTSSSTTMLSQNNLMQYTNDPTAFISIHAAPLLDLHNNNISSNNNAPHNNHHHHHNHNNHSQLSHHFGTAGGDSTLLESSLNGGAGGVGVGGNNANLGTYGPMMMSQSSVHGVDSLIAANHNSTEEERHVIQEAFHTIDLDSKGYLSMDQIRDVIIALKRGERVSREDVEGIYNELLSPSRRSSTSRHHNNYTNLNNHSNTTALNNNNQAQQQLMNQNNNVGINNGDNTFSPGRNTFGSHNYGNNNHQGIGLNNNNVGTTATANLIMHQDSSQQFSDRPGSAFGMNTQSSEHGSDISPERQASDFHHSISQTYGGNNRSQQQQNGRDHFSLQSSKNNINNNNSTTLPYNSSSSNQALHQNNIKNNPNNNNNGVGLDSNGSSPVRSEPPGTYQQPQQQQQQYNTPYHQNNQTSNQRQNQNQNNNTNHGSPSPTLNNTTSSMHNNNKDRDGSSNFDETTPSSIGSGRGNNYQNETAGGDTSSSNTNTNINNVSEEPLTYRQFLDYWVMRDGDHDEVIAGLIGPNTFTLRKLAELSVGAESGIVGVSAGGGGGVTGGGLLNSNGVGLDGKSGKDNHHVAGTKNLMSNTFSSAGLMSATGLGSNDHTNTALAALAMSNLSSPSREPAVVADLRKAFDKLDKTHSGTFNTANLKEVLLIAAKAARSDAELDLLGEDDINRLAEALASRFHNRNICFYDFVAAILDDEVLTTNVLGASLATALGLQRIAFEHADAALQRAAGVTLFGTPQEILDVLQQCPKLKLVGALPTATVTGGSESMSQTPLGSALVVGGGAVPPPHQQSGFPSSPAVATQPTAMPKVSKSNSTAANNANSLGNTPQTACIVSPTAPPLMFPNAHSTNLDSTTSSSVGSHTGTSLQPTGQIQELKYLFRYSKNGFAAAPQTPAVASSFTVTNTTTPTISHLASSSSTQQQQIQNNNHNNSTHLDVDGISQTVSAGASPLPQSSLPPISSVTAPSFASYLERNLPSSPGILGESQGGTSFSSYMMSTSQQKDAAASPMMLSTSKMLPNSQSSTNLHNTQSSFRSGGNNKLKMMKLKSGGEAGVGVGVAGNGTANASSSLSSSNANATSASATAGTIDLKIVMRQADCRVMTTIQLRTSANYTSSQKELWKEAVSCVRDVVSDMRLEALKMSRPTGDSELM